MSLEQIPWILSMVVIPVLIFLVNLIIRHNKQIPLSTGADLLLLLLAYDASIILDPSLIESMASEKVKAYVRDIHGLFLCGYIITWLITVSYIENTLNHYYIQKSQGNTQLGFPLWSYITPWAIALASVIGYFYIIKDTGSVTGN